VEGLVETADEPQPLPQGQLHPLVYCSPTDLTCSDAVLTAFAHDHWVRTNDIRDSLFDLMTAVRGHIRYLPGTTDSTTTAAAAFSRGAGVCQDHAHVYIAACRALGVPARYVSGYFYTSNKSQLASHAWVDAWVEKLGWVSFDITHSCLADGRLCRLAVGRDYLEASPVRGVRVGGGAETLQVSVQVAA
jgi:transglutaminase-like putative cysteine protease